MTYLMTVFPRSWHISSLVTHFPHSWHSSLALDTLLSLVTHFPCSWHIFISHDTLSSLMTLSLRSWRTFLARSWHSSLAHDLVCWSKGKSLFMLKDVFFRYISMCISRKSFFFLVSKSVFLFFVFVVVWEVKFVCLFVCLCWRGVFFIYSNVCLFVFLLCWDRMFYILILSVI